MPYRNPPFGSVGEEQLATGIAPFISAAGVITQRENYTDDFVVGSPQLDDDGDPAHDRRMFFDKSKGYFFAGEVTSTQVDEAARDIYGSNIGSYNCTSGGSTNRRVSFLASASCTANSSFQYSLCFIASSGCTASNEQDNISFITSDNCTASGYAQRRINFLASDNCTASGGYQDGISFIASSSCTASGDHDSRVAFIASSSCTASNSTVALIAASQCHISHEISAVIASRYAVSTSKFQLFRASGRNSVNGDAQSSWIPWHDITTHNDGTAQDIVIDGYSYSRPTVTDTTYCSLFLCTGLSQGSAKSFVFIIAAHIENDGSSLSIKSQSVLWSSVADDVSFTLAVVASGTDYKLQATDSDGAGDTIHWSIMELGAEARKES